jgi:hypothetical protein
VRPLTWFVPLVATLAIFPTAVGQVPEPKALETVITRSGEVVMPWEKRQICRRTTGRCDWAVVNLETGEIARMGEVLGSEFEATSNGQEVRRAETARDRAVRLERER